MEINESTDGGRVTLTVVGRLDTGSADRFAAALSSHIDGGARRILVDLAGVDYMSSVGLRALVTAAKHLEPSGGRIVLCAPQPRIRQLFEIAGFLSIFKIVATREEAAES
jgi:anti-anti-sigma factor